MADSMVDMGSTSVSESCTVCQVILLRTDVTGFRDTLCDTQPVSQLSESDEIFAVEVPPVCSPDHVTAVVVNTDASCSLR